MLHELNNRPWHKKTAPPLPAEIPSGERNATLASLAGKLRYAGLEETEILSALLEINSARCKPPLAPEEVADLAASIANRYPKGDFRVLWEQGGSDSWEDPQPLADSLPPVEPLNSNLLPSAIKPWVEDNSERMQCPIEYPAVGAIVALGALIGRQLSIRPKRFDHWTVVPNLWGAIIGRPGVMKTPAVAETLKPLQRLEVRAKEVFEEELKEAAAKEIYSEARQKD